MQVAYCGGVCSRSTPTMPLSPYVQVGCERAVAAGDWRRSHV